MRRTLPATAMLSVLLATVLSATPALAADPPPWRSAQQILDGLGAVLASAGGGQPVLLVPPQLRPHVRRLVERSFPALAVLSHNEINSQIRIQSVGTVTIDARQGV